VRHLVVSAELLVDRREVGVEQPRLEELFTEHYLRLVRLAYLLTGNSQIAEELVQDVFTRLAETPRQMDHPGAYLRTSVVNACRSWMRRERLARDRRVVPDRVEQDPEAKELDDLLSALPARQRAALILRFYEDLPEAEIAEVLGCRPGTVKSLIHRGLNALRQEVTR
jgi:RNA polymerase sigma-70 factor (sigma-E family)